MIPSFLRGRWWAGERARIILLLLVLAAGYWLISREWSGDAAKGAVRMAKAHTENHWAPVKVYAAVGTYAFALFNAAFCVLLALSTPLWHRVSGVPRQGGEGVAPAADATQATGRVGRGFMFGLLAIVVLTGALRLPLAVGGFWHDECLQMQRINGYYRLDRLGDDGLPEFRPAPWIETFFHYRKPTNHTALGVPARLSLEAWRSVSGVHERPKFSEVAVRLPSLLAAMGSVVLLALLGARWGMPRAGLLAALLLAIHPWFIRWGVDARAYSLGIFSLTLGLYALTAALQTGRWRWWLLFGFAQALLLWTSLLHLWLAGALVVVAGVWLLRRHGFSGAFPMLGRLFLVNAVAATLFFQVMGPNLMQFVQASKMRAPSEESFTKLNAVTGMDTASNLLLGLPYRVPLKPGDRAITTWETLFDGHAFAGGALLVSHLLLLLGGVMVWRRHPPAGVILAGLGLGFVAHLGTTAAFNLYYYPRFVTYLMPVAMLLTAATWVAATGKRPWLAWVGAPAFLLITAWPQVANLLRHEHEPFRPIMAAVEEQRAAAPDGKVIAACYGLAGDIMQKIYDPSIRFIHKQEQIEALMEESRSTGHPLFIAYGNQSFNRVTLPKGFVLLDNPDKFDMIRRFEANDPRHTFFLLRWVEKGARPSHP